jgi:hypothetical protein
MVRALSPERVRNARILAVVADAVQIAAFPVFFNPVLEPLNLVFDVVMALVFIGLVGWHWALLPAFISEAIPGWDLVPTWTAAVFLATRRREVEATPVEATVVPQKGLPDPREREHQ